MTATSDDGVFWTDVTRLCGRAPGRLRLAWSLCSQPGLLAVALLRLQDLLRRRRLQPLAKIVQTVNVAVTGAEFVVGCSIGPGLVVRHPNGIVIGGGARIGCNCTLLQQVTLGERHADGSGDHAYPVVGDQVILGVGARVLGAVRVGDRAVVGACALVLDDVPSDATVGGVPARLLSRAASTGSR